MLSITDMFRIFTYILIGFVLLFPYQPAWAEDAASVDPEIQLCDLINQARVNPLAMAASVGLNPDQVLADLPGLREILTQGLPPLNYNAKLRESARLHTGDMLENGYYGYISPDGSTPADRIRNAGYVADITGESLGVLGFFNFISPSEAVSRIFENLYRDELNPDRTESRYILSPDLTDVGIGFGEGTLSISENSYNAYLVTCDFATTAVSRLESELLQMINQARSNPLKVAAALGMNTYKIWADLPELHDILENGIPPLSFNGILYEAAQAHARDMLKQDYYSDVSLDGRNVYDRLFEKGYDPAIAAEARRLLATTDFVSPEEGCKKHFRQLLEQELNPGCENRIILNSDLKEAGVSLVSFVPEMWSVAEEGISYSDFYTLMMVIDFGAGAESLPTELQGIVYNDQNQNSLLDFGEGILNIPINISNDNLVLSVFTDSSGSFAVNAEKGVYDINLSSDNAVYAQEVVLEQNRFVEFQISDFLPAD
ncbi:CAP domain-containing protein [Desulfonema ishimotonii]|uniref:CAP domain-containing protein n=1 Tax=Desulfonema ishimotonii TaxID=45657 RepID=UPI0014092651|nr:CAP domain-containing protein [Desulfonema ishimotonii]